MKYSYAFFMLLFLVQYTYGNMASPVRRGTLGSSAISSKDIDILSEKIIISVHKELTTAKYVIEYTIQTDMPGKQVPLLFYAVNYKDSFLVWLNNKPIALQNVPGNQGTPLPLLPFNNTSQQQNNEILIYWEKDKAGFYERSDLKYFEADIPKGIHKVRVEYTANAWTNHSNWIKEYGFRYSLSPARYWRSFGTLEIIIEQEGPVQQISTNLGMPKEKEIKATNTWLFSKLPGEFIEISFVPETGSLAKMLIRMGPLALSITASVILVLVHIILVLRYRKKHPAKKNSPMVTGGSLLVPLLALLAYSYAYNLVDMAIGEHASRYHGYVFLSIIFYPLLLLFYWPLTRLTDRFYQKKITHKAANG